MEVICKIIITFLESPSCFTMNSDIRSSKLAAMLGPRNPYLVMLILLKLFISYSYIFLSLCYWYMLLYPFFIFHCFIDAHLEFWKRLNLLSYFLPSCFLPLHFPLCFFLVIPIHYWILEIKIVHYLITGVYCLKLFLFTFLKTFVKCLYLNRKSELFPALFLITKAQSLDQYIPSGTILDLSQKTRA